MRRNALAHPLVRRAEFLMALAYATDLATGEFEVLRALLTEQAKTAADEPIYPDLRGRLAGRLVPAR